MASIEQIEQQASDVYLAPPSGIKKWPFLTVVCSAQLFVQGAFGYILIPLHLVGNTLGTDETNVVASCKMDISFPALAIILSNSVPVKHQGAAASLVNTAVNYSIARGLGIAGSVKAEVSPDGADLLLGYRAALWTSVGLSALAVVIVMIYAVCTECSGLKPWRNRVSMDN